MNDKIEVTDKGVNIYFDEWSVEELQNARDMIDNALDKHMRYKEWLHKFHMGDPSVYSQTWEPVKEIA